MKKLMVLVLSLVCVLSLVGCNNTQPEKQSVSQKEQPDFPEKKLVSNDNSYSDVEGISVEIDGMYIYPDMTTLLVSWNNNTEFEATYGNDFLIERLENGKWVDCSLQANIFTLAGYMLNANETVDKEYRLTDLYDVSKPGTYRFCSDCIVDITDEEFSECSVWAEFIIE